MARLYSMSRVRPTNKDMDTIRRRGFVTGDRNTDLLMEAQAAYMGMRRFREERERNKRYTYGDQWGDPISVDGEVMTEGDYLRKQGCLPLKNNLIRRLVRNVIGVYRSQATEPTCISRDRDEQKLGETMSTILQYNMQLNRMNEVYARSLEEFLISGIVVHKKTYGWRNDKTDCWTDYIQPNNFFVDSNMRDFRTWDGQIIGEIHDVDFNEVVQKFATGPMEFGRLAEIYSIARQPKLFVQSWDDFGFPKDREIDFLVPYDETLCRVIEVWKKESKPRYRCHDYNTGELFKIDLKDYKAMVQDVNDARLQQGLSAGMAAEDIPLIEAEWFIDNYWYYYFLSPFGDVLQQGETPYEHKSHPYVFKAYPFLDSEIHSFVSDVIDQQRYTNRLITLYDWIMRASAKGVLMIPRDSLKGVSLEDFAKTWAKPNGVITYEPSKSGQVPHQIASNSTNVGINELLNLQLKFFEEISGVNGALQGKPGYSGMSASLYAQQTQNATTSLLDLLDTFNDFVCEAAKMDVKNMQQYYDQKRVFNIAGKSSVVEYDPQKIRDVEFDLSIIPSQATPVYRAMVNDFLMQIWSSGQITLQQMLQVGKFPFGDELLQSIEAQQEEAQKQQEAMQALQGAMPADAGQQQMQAPPQQMQQ